MEQQPPASPLLSKSSGPAHEPASSFQPGSEKPRKRNRWVWIVLLSIFALAVWLILRHKPGEGESARGRHGRFGGTVTLNAATAHEGRMAVKLLAIGTVTPTYTASITSQVTGQIVAVHYHEGQTVHKGDALIDIFDGPYRAALDTAKGALERDQALLAQAQMDLKRYQDAWARNSIARQMLDDQEKLVMQDQGLVKSDEGTVEADQVNVNFCHIVAPITGKVGLRLVDPGNIVQGNSTSALVVIAQVEPITVVFTIPEDNLPQVETAMHSGNGPLTVDATDRTGTIPLGNGTVITTDNQIDTTTGTVKLRAMFPNSKSLLFPNQFVNTQLLVSILHNQVLIPSSAIQQNGTQAYVYLIRDGKAKITNVKVVQSDTSNSAVTGLSYGDVVATSSFEKLQDGSEVRVVKEKLAASDNAESATP